MRRLLHLPRWTLRVAVALVVVLALAFVVLTRTEVGREGVRRGLEAAFARQFDGTLHIERLTGNLVGTLYAGGIEVRGPDGALLLEADSLILRPTFRGVLAREFALREAVLVRPHLSIRADSSGLNVARLLRREATRAEAQNPWHFTTARIRLLDGTLDVESTVRVPPAVAEGRLWDYRTLHAEDLDATLRLELGGTRRRVEVDDLTARLSDPALPLAFTGIWTADATGHRLHGLGLRVGDSQVRGHLAWLPGTPQPFALEGALDLTELRAFFPSLPVRDRVAFTASGAAAPGAVQVARADVRRGTSRVEAAGMLTWSGGGVALDGITLSGNLRQRDLLAVWPEAPARVRTWSDQARFEVAGSALLPAGEHGRATAEARFSYRGAEGTIRGQVHAQRQERWRVAGDVTAARLPGSLLDLDLRDTELSGTVRGDLGGASLATLRGEATLRLGPSRLLGRPVDSLAASVRLDPASFDVTGRAMQGEARWSVAASGNRDGSRLDGTVRADRARLRGLLPETPLDAFFSGTAALAYLDAPAGQVSGRLDLALDTLVLSRDTVSASFDAVTARASLTDDGRFSAHLASDAADADITAWFSSGDPLGALGGWQEVARAAILRMRPQEPDAALPSEPMLLTERPQAPIEADVRLDLRDAARLRPLHPALARLGPVHLGVQVRGDTDALHLAADGALAGPRITRTASDSLRLATRLTVTSAAWLHGQTTLTADTLRLGPVVLPEAAAHLQIADGQAQLRLHSSTDEGDVAHLAARLDVRTRAAFLMVDTLQLTAGPYRIETAAAQRLPVFRDRIVFPDFTLRTDDGVGGLTLRGALSPSPTDTLFAHVNGLPLAPVSARMGPRFQFGGRFDADAAITGVFVQPEITGRLDAHALTWGRHVVGDVRVNSFYTPGSPDVSLALDVRPAADSVAGFLPTDSRVSVNGSFRLPSRLDPGRLDLAVRADSADAFFFDNLFPTFIAGAAGRIGGDGHIGGTFERPLFEADLQIAAARFRIPAFNLAYTATARAVVDARGIHVHGGQVRDAGGGVAHLDGSVLFNDYRFFSLDVTGQLDRLLFLNVVQSPTLAFYGRMRASGDVRLTGPFSAARLASSNAVLTDDSEVFIPLRATAGVSDPGYIVFADSTGRLPDLQRLTQRTSVIGQVEGERDFTAGLEMDLFLQAPSGVTVNLVTDPLAGDVMRAVSSGRVQLLRRDGDFILFGTLDVTGGEYLFTAGDLFVRRFAINAGTLSWDGSPLDPTLDVQAQYATRASLAGTPYAGAESRFVPLLVRLSVQDRLSALSLGLRLELDRSDRGRPLTDLQEIEQFLNQPDRQAEYATSVLLTNSFLLTTSLTDPGATETLASTGNRFAFASLSQLVATQLNRYLAAVLPGVDFNLGVQGERADELDLTYGIALRLLDERLVIRGAGLLRTDNTADEPQGLQGEFVVEVRLSSAVSVEVFYRREEDVLQRIVTASTGAGLSYRTQFTSWGAFWRRLTGQPPPRDQMAMQER